MNDYIKEKIDQGRFAILGEQGRLVLIETNGNDLSLRNGDIIKINGVELSRHET